MLRKAISLFILTACLTVSLAASAESLIVDGIDTASASGYPDGGITKENVESKWGAPVKRSSPVGEPPISSWEYDPFVVYFEYDRVIHSVAKR